MRPIDPGESYGWYTVFGANQPEYLPLPARIDQEGATFTIFDLSLDERKAIMDGARIGLRIATYGSPLQPFHVAVEGTEEWPYETVPTTPEER